MKVLPRPTAPAADVDGKPEGAPDSAILDLPIQLVIQEMSSAKSTTGTSSTLQALQNAAVQLPAVNQLLVQHGWMGSRFCKAPSWSALLQGLLRVQKSLKSRELAEIEPDQELTLAKVLIQQTQMLEKMQRPRDPLQGLFDDSSGGAGSSSSGGIGAGKGLEAMTMMRKEFQDHPERYYLPIESRLARCCDREGETVFPEQHFQQRCPLGSYQGSVNWMAIMAALWKHLMKGEVDHARALAALSYCAGEQVALDKGSWNLAFLFTLLPKPPYQMIAQHRPEALDEAPAAELMEEKWIIMLQSFMGDQDRIAERRKKMLSKKKGGGKEKEEA